MVQVLLGDFTFIEPHQRVEIVNGRDFNKTYTALINKIEKVVEVEESELDDFCENSLSMYESYLIPSMYNGNIIYPN
jgi:hypothetical protein